MIVKPSNSSLGRNAHRRTLSGAFVRLSLLSSFGVSLGVSLPCEEYNENEERYVDQEKRDC